MSEITAHGTELETLRQSLQRVGDELREAERLCARIAELAEADADSARARLDAGRREFSTLRLQLLRELDLTALGDPRAAELATSSPSATFTPPLSTRILLCA